MERSQQVGAKLLLRRRMKKSAGANSKMFILTPTAKLSSGIYILFTTS